MTAITNTHLTWKTEMSQETWRDWPDDSIPHRQYEKAHEEAHRRPAVVGTTSSYDFDTEDLYKDEEGNWCCKPYSQSR